MKLIFKAAQIIRQGQYKDLFIDYRLLGFEAHSMGDCRCIQIPDNYHTSAELLELVNNEVEVTECPMFLKTTQQQLDEFQAGLEEPIVFDREHEVVADKLLVLLNTPGRHMDGSEWVRFAEIGEFLTLAEKETRYPAPDAL
jgi:hypothetical protein